jgi:hypothetical protein
MHQSHEEQRREFRELVAPGAGIVGGVAGTAIGLITAGPVGAFAGAVLGPTVEYACLRLGSEFMHRQISEREVVRIGGALAVAVTRINERLEKGEQLRQDGFFAAEGFQRSAANEVGEGVLLAAQREHEEKKVPLLGSLLASIAFDSEISRPQANLLLRLGEELSYQQLCVLALLGDNQLDAPEGPEFDSHEVLGLRNEKFVDENVGELASMDHAGLLQELADLYSRLLITGSGPLGSRPAGGIMYTMPSSLRIQGVGLHLYRSMELWNIDETDIEQTTSLLR